MRLWSDCFGIGRSEALTEPHKSPVVDISSQEGVLAFEDHAAEKAMWNGWGIEM